MKLIRCKTCNSLYRQKRKDQKYCTLRCRNSFNNSNYREQLLPYRAILEKARLTENIIEKLFLSGVSFLKVEELYKFNIELNNGLKIYVDSKNHIKHAIFGRYFINAEENLYRISKSNV
jgi:hypothetical protein